MSEKLLFEVSVMPKSLKKLILYFLVTVGIIYGYQLVAGKGIATLPGELVDKIQSIGSTPQTESTNPHYYTDPEKSMPKD
jgi:hypothetical protein